MQGMLWNCVVGCIRPASREFQLSVCDKLKANCGQETRFLLNRIVAVLCLLLGFILQVCVPRVTKDICLVVMSHSSIMSHIIWVYTPWPVRLCARGEHLRLLFLFNGMSLPVQLHPKVARACRPLFVLSSSCSCKKSHKSMSFVTQNIPAYYRIDRKSGSCLHCTSQAFRAFVQLNVLYLYDESTARGLGYYGGTTTWTAWN